ncbi:MAG: hypothetical protein ACFBRM_07205 [Pikeienuella sp.]
MVKWILIVVLFLALLMAGIALLSTTLRAADAEGVLKALRGQLAFHNAYFAESCPTAQTVARAAERAGFATIAFDETTPQRSAPGTGPFAGVAVRIEPRAPFSKGDGLTLFVTEGDCLKRPADWVELLDQETDR